MDNVFRVLVVVWLIFLGVLEARGAAESILNDGRGNQWSVEKSDCVPEAQNRAHFFIHTLVAQEVYGLVPFKMMGKINISDLFPSGNEGENMRDQLVQQIDFFLGKERRDHGSFPTISVAEVVAENQRKLNIKSLLIRPHLSICEFANLVDRIYGVNDHYSIAQ